MPSLTRWKLPKSRSGRRPISVSTLLKRDSEGKLFKKHAFELQGETKFQGLDIAIENDVGSVRKGTNADGSTWKTVFKSPYGYIRGTEGADGEEVDCYVGPKRDANTAFVVHQKKDDGSYDEDTVMLGYDDKESAKADILRHYSDPKYVGSIHAVSMERLHELLDSGKKLVKISHIISNNIPEFDADDEAEKATGIPAHLRKHPGDVPSRDEVDLLPNPKTEQRNEMRGMVNIGGFPSPGGEDDFGKFGRALDSLGDISRSWEVPTSDDLGTSSADPGLSRRTARETDDRTHFVSLTEIGDAAVDSRAQEAGDLKVAAAFIDELQKVAAANGGHTPWVGELDDFRDYVSSTLTKMAVELTSSDARAALTRLGELEATRPTEDQLVRSALTGAVIGPISGNMNRLISAGQFAKPREMVGQVASGALFGGAMPYLKHELESGAERRKLRHYIASRRGGRLVTQIENKLGTP